MYIIIRHKDNGDIVPVLSVENEETMAQFVELEEAEDYASDLPDAQVIKI